MGSLTNRVSNDSVEVVVVFFMEMAILAMLAGQVIHTPNQLLVLKSGKLCGGCVGRGALELLTETQLWLMDLHLAQHGMHSHLHLWEAIQSTWREKGSALHLVVRKVKGHRTAAKCHGDPMLLLEKRLNDGADKLAVVAAERHQVPVALQTSCNGEWKRIWPLQQTWLNIHMARETVIRIRNLDGIHNSSSTEVAPTPAPRVSQPEVPRQLGCLDGTSPAEEQPPAMFPRYSWDPTSL